MEVNSEQGGEVVWVVDQEGGEEAMDTAVGSLCPKVSSLEKLRLLEEISTLKISADKSQNGSDVISSGAESQDSLPMKIMNGNYGDSMELSPISDQTEDVDLSMGCKTPDESIFDPFAPGPEELALAPKKKISKETKISLRRRLNFDIYFDSIATAESDTGEDGLDDETLLETFSDMFLELVISSQIKELSVKNLVANSSPTKGFKTPANLPLLTGIAETCPPAPRRPTLKLRKLSDSICRKLEFGEQSVEELLKL